MRLEAWVIESNQPQRRFFDLPHASAGTIALVVQRAECRTAGQAEAAVDAIPHQVHVDVGDWRRHALLIQLVLEIERCERAHQRVTQMPPTKRPALRIPFGSSASLSARITAKPGGGGPETSTPCLTAGGAAATTTCPSAPAAARRTRTAEDTPAAGTRSSRIPAAGCTMTWPSLGSASARLAKSARGTMARSSADWPAGADQSRAASQNEAGRSRPSAPPPASRRACT